MQMITEQVIQKNISVFSIFKLNKSFLLLLLKSAKRELKCLKISCFAINLFFFFLQEGKGGFSVDVLLAWFFDKDKTNRSISEFV